MSYSLPNFTQEGGLEVVGQELARQVDWFWSLILAFIFVVIWGVGYFSMERRVGSGNAAMWCSIAGLITTTGSFILFLYDGLVPIITPTISLIITIAGAFWFILSDRF